MYHECFCIEKYKFGDISPYYKTKTGQTKMIRNLLCALTSMYGSESCPSYVPVLRYSYCMPFQSSPSLYQCTLLPICTVATVQLLYAIPILNVIISVHTVTNMYGSHSCQSDVAAIQYILSVRCNATFTVPVTTPVNLYIPL